MANVNYFVTHNYARSNERLDIADCSIEVLEKHLEAEYARHALCKGSSNYPSLIMEWLSRLDRGFHLLVRGVGSKKNLFDTLTRHIKSQSKDVHIFRFHGFTPIKSLDLVVDHVFRVCNCDDHKNEENRDDLFALCRKAILASGKHIYIIIHCLEDFERLNPKVCEFLLKLAQFCAGRVSVVASSMHINVAQLIGRLSGNINWMYYNTPTYLSPYHERSMVATTITRDVNEHKLDRLLHKDLYLQGIKDTYESLQNKAKEVMVIILEQFIAMDDEIDKDARVTKSSRKKKDAKKTPVPKKSNFSTIDYEGDDEDYEEENSGDDDDTERNNGQSPPKRSRSSKRTLPMKKLYEDCSDRLLVRRPANLFSYLKEFSDHNITLPLEKKMLNADIELAMPLDVARKFLEWQKTTTNLD